MTPARQSEGFHIPSLDGLRTVAWAIVFFSHVGGERLIPGGLGVTVFFFLSGFLITTLMRVEDEKTGSVSLRQFYLRRVLRILPPLYITLGFAALVSVYIGVTPSGFTLLAQAAHLTNYHLAYAPTQFRALGTDVLWSVAIEEHFYLVFPLAFLALRRLTTSGLLRAAAILGACLVVLVWRIFIVTSLHLAPEHTTYATDARIDSILFGCALALYRNPALPGPRLPERTVWIGFACGLVLLVVSVAIRAPFFRNTFRYTVQGLALAPVFVAAIRFPDRFPFRILNLRPVRWTGQISYGLYLVHELVIRMMRPTLGHSDVKLALGAILGAFALATVMYYAVEKPCAKIRRRLSRVAITDELQLGAASASSTWIQKRLLVFLLPIVLVALVYFETVTPVVRRYFGSSDLYSLAQRSVEAARDDHFDTVFLGNSRVFRGVDPAFIESKAHNFALDDDSFVYYPAKVRFLFETGHTLRHAFLGVDIFQLGYWSYDRYFAYRDEFQDADFDHWTLDPYYGPHLVWHALDYRVSMRDTYRVALLARLRGLPPATRDESYAEDANGFGRVAYANPHPLNRELVPRSEIDADAVVQLERAVVLLRERGVDVILFVPPASADFRAMYGAEQRARFDAVIDGIVKRDGARFQSWEAATGFEDEDFPDGLHLSAAAAARFSGIVSAWLGP